MARTILAAQQVSRSGLTPAFSAGNADGHYVPNDGKMMLEVKNASASPITVTIQTPGTVDGNAIADLVVTVPANTGDKMIGPFPPSIYNQADGSIYADLSAVTSVTLAALRLA